MGTKSKEHQQISLLVRFTMTLMPTMFSHKSSNAWRSQALCPPTLSGKRPARASSLAKFENVSCWFGSFLSFDV